MCGIPSLPYRLFCLWGIERSVLELRIAMIGHKTVPSRDGGVEVAVEALAVRMAALGHDVTLYNRGNKQKNSSKTGSATYRGVHIRCVPVLPCRGISAAIGSFFATILALFGHYDCIHFHAEGPAIMAFLPHLFGIRTVVTIHGLDWQRSKWGRFASWYLHQGEKAAVKFADEIIVLSQATRQYFRDTYNRDTRYIRNGVEHLNNEAPDLIRSKWGLDTDGYILYLGRIVPEKGLHYLIKAFRNVSTIKKLVIAGSASGTDAFYRQMVEAAKGDDRILFTGFVQGQVLDELYSNCYLYCLPSDLEGMPISLLEAMSHGNCCLVSDIPECAEVVGSAGFYCKAGDVSDLRQVLQKLCNWPELVDACKKQLDDQFFARHNWDEIAMQTLALYRSEKSS